MNLKTRLRAFLPPVAILGFQFFRGFLAALIHGFPASRMRVIGVTGTKGKTTTAHLLADILERAGEKVGLTSTVRFRIGGREFRNETNQTVVSPFKLQSLLAQMRRSKTDFAVVEVTSHGIAQHRLVGIPFELAVFTNLSHDHLDYHRSFADYRETKRRLFLGRRVRASVINRDDKNWTEFYRIGKPTRLLYGLEDRSRSRQDKEPRPDVVARKIISRPDGTTFTLVSPVGQVVIESKLFGDYNVSNSLAAAAAAIALSVPLSSIKRGLETTTGIPGRLEPINLGQEFAVILDYAHNPDSLEQVLRVAKERTRGKLILVFGATGDRDKTKRPIMGAIAGKLADRVVITDEEPYSESPAAIRGEIIAGLIRARPKNRSGEQSASQPGENDRWFEIPNRRAGLKKGLSLADRGDLVLITGMGDQRFMTVAGRKRAWNERKVVEELILNRKGR